MNKFLFVFPLIFVVALSADTDCDYVKNNYWLTDATKVKNCFNKYVLPDGLVKSIIDQLETAEQIYPYVEIASNPPSYPSQEYFGKFNYSTEFPKLKEKLLKSGGVVSKVYRPTMQFIAAFHDGHFSLSSSYTEYNNNIFASVSGVFPFTWAPLGVYDDRIRVQLYPTQVTSVVAPNIETVLKQKIDNDVYADKIDGKDAFEFFRDFFKKINDMKSAQGKLWLSRLYTGSSFFRLTFYPIDDEDFGTHTIQFSDGSTLAFTLAFRNARNAPSQSRDLDILPEYDITPKGGPDSDVIDAVLNFKRTPKSRRVRAENKYVSCGRVNTLNYIVFTTFSADSSDEIQVFLDEAADCIENIDDNKSPIAILLLRNGGGYDIVSTVLKSWLMPTSDARYLKAVKKTDTNKDVVSRYYGSGIRYVDGCKSIGKTKSDFNKFWEVTEEDDFGKGAVHKRTQKFFDSYYDFLGSTEWNGLKKNIRKPTDVIVVTDGYCFSACSYFVNGVMEVGSAITAGIGTANIGDEKFVSSQCPSNVVSSLPDYITSLKEDATKYGIKVGVTLGETYHIQKNINGTLIPRDYTISRIDENIGDFFVPYELEKILKKVEVLHNDYQTKCNPDNQHLLMYTDKCNSEDPNAEQMGYACGTDGKWDKNNCRIATCKPGYIVDFESNSCIINECGKRRSAASHNIVHFGSMVFLIFALFVFLF